MTTRKRIAAWGCAALLAALAVCGALSESAAAREVPDMTRTGSISGTMACEGSSVGGGCVVLYQVGDVVSDDGNYAFVLTEEFAASEESLEDVSSTVLAETLAAYALEMSCEGITVDVEDDGTWVASELELGLYLVDQYEPADGYEAISPFLVSVPSYDEAAEEYVYDTDAEPKMSLLSVVEDEPEEEVEEEVPVYTMLPQTGQLNWPVPILAIAGTVLFSVGYNVRRGDPEKRRAA